MSKSYKKDNKYNYILMAMVVIIVGIMMIYAINSQNRMENYAKYTVEQNVEKISRSIDSHTSEGINSIQLTAHLVTKVMDGPILKNSVDVLGVFLEQTPFDFIEYIDSNGLNITEKGPAFDANDRTYFIEGMKGNTGIWIDYNPMYSDEYLVDFYTPLYYHGEIVGVLNGAIGADTNIKQLIETDFFNEEMTGILCDESGRIIVATGEIDRGDTLDDFLNQIGVSREEQASFYKRMEAKNGHVFEFTGNNGNAIACESVNELTGWRIIQIVPPESFQRVVRRNSVDGYLAVFVIVVLLSTYLVYWNLNSKAKEKELVEENKRVVQHYEQILTATVADTSKGIRRVDLNTEETDYFYFENNCLKQTRFGNWTDWFDTQEKYIQPTDYENVKTFLSINQLRAMERGVTYRTNYHSAKRYEDDEARSYTTTASMIEVEGKRFAIITTIDSTEAVRKEREQKQLLVSAASIYVSMHVFDLKNDTMEVLCCADHIASLTAGRQDHVQSLLVEVMSLMTDEQFLDQMLRFIDFQTLDERMQGMSTITLEFLGKKSGWCRARFIAVDYDKDQRLRHVLWMVENIDKEKRRANQLLYLSETDLMTGIRNRGSGEKRIRELLAENHEGTLCVMDVDDFKSINDNYGHEAGDRVLATLAKCMKETFTDADVVMRLGGDEFAVFMDGIVDRGRARERIRQFFDRIEQMDFPEIRGRSIAVSLGAAITGRDDGCQFEELYRNADACTYKSKAINGSAYTFFE